MSLPTALVVSRYRAFAGEEALPLRPLTLLYGRNNSGKSALARALAIIGASVAEDAASALVTPREILRGDFTDLAWQGDAGDYTFDLGLRWDDGEVPGSSLHVGRRLRAVVLCQECGSEARVASCCGRVLPHLAGRCARRPATEAANCALVGLVPRDSEVPLPCGAGGANDGPARPGAVARRCTCTP